MARCGGGRRVARGVASALGGRAVRSALPGDWGVAWGQASSVKFWRLLELQREGSAAIAQLDMNGRYFIGDVAKWVLKNVAICDA